MLKPIHMVHFREIIFYICYEDDASIDISHSRLRIPDRKAEHIDTTGVKSTTTRDSVEEHEPGTRAQALLLSFIRRVVQSL